MVSQISTANVCKYMIFDAWRTQQVQDYKILIFVRILLNYVVFDNDDSISIFYTMDMFM
jgi:hypothetical protein